MLTVVTVAAMQRRAREWRARNLPVAFVPTMGSLHAGHLSLIGRARQAIGRNGRVAVSFYVNPTQFGPNEDLAQYPRDFFNDKRLCRQAGADVFFAPSDREMYPEGFSTHVIEDRLSQGMEGAARPGHFRGVATVVAKLFHIIQPNLAVFGAKDFQQTAVVRKMVSDLNFPLKIVVAPTEREPGGLALSSRNTRLSPDQHRQAAILWQAIQRARAAAASGAMSAARLKEQLRALIASQPEARADYIEFFDPQTLAPARQVKKGTHLALAVFIGKTRLIDNAAL
jgi:pantoate--beta-alanine ligase